jgi:drug/metabolite transporter (DMT)-like permease
VTTLPFLAVLASALLHASWNAFARVQGNPGHALAVGVMVSGIVSIPAMLFVGLPDAPALPWLVAGVIINSAGIRVMMAAYRRIPFGLAYPVARAGIPLMALPMSLVLFDEQLRFGPALGVLAIAVAILLLALTVDRSGERQMTGLGFALLASLAGAGYVACDAMGVRLSGNGYAYAFAVAVGNGIALALMMWFEKLPPHRLIIDNFSVGCRISFVSMLSFMLYVWALLHAPIALVAALRETSVLFATIIAAVFLRERIGPLHWMSACLAVGGIAAIRLA